MRFVLRHTRFACFLLAPLLAGCAETEIDPFGDHVAGFTAGEAAGFGQEGFPEMVLGPPDGGGENSGSLDVVSLGRKGLIIIEMTDIGLVDGPGVDLLVFENPFTAWLETGEVAVSEDGQNWHSWPCDGAAADLASSGCAGIKPVYASADNEIDATDPAMAGGDGFDLADLGIPRARFVRIQDSGFNTYLGDTGGFDLDAVAVVNGELL